MIAKTSGNGAAPASPPPRPEPVPTEPSGAVAASRPPAAAPGRCRRTPPPGRRTPPRLIATAKAPSGNGGTWASPCSKRSEERRVGEEWRCWRSGEHYYSQYDDCLYVQNVCEPVERQH